MRRHTPYTRDVERLIAEIRRGFLDAATLERKLVDIGLLEDADEADMLWSHTIYGNGGVPPRHALTHHLRSTVLSALRALNERGTAVVLRRVRHDLWMNAVRGTRLSPPAPKKTGS